MLSSKSDSRKTQQLGSDDLVPFDHAAAGHDGVRCTLSGSLIAKPCTRQEVEFYESSALHPGFQEFMPIFIGSLSSAEQQQPLAIAAAQQSGAVFLPALGDAPSTAPAREASTSQDGNVSVEGEPAKAADSAWVPSDGKKLDTGLSIVLENVASGFRRPNVLDVKLGARLWADDAPPAKRNKLDAVAKETTSSSLGYRIAGMKVWTGKNGDTDEGSLTDPYATKYEGKEGAKGEVIEKDGYRRYDKWYGRSFTEETVKQGFETFLAGAKEGKVDRSRMIAQRLVEELRNVQQVLESEESRMYSASVLIIYEGDPEAMEHALEEEKKIPDPRDQDGEEEDEEEDDEDVEFEITEGSLELVDVQLEGGIPQKAVNITIDPSTAQLPTLGDDDDEEEDAPKVHDLRLIDFAHATWTPGAGPDENVLMGIRSLIKVFQDLAV
ncbi:Inositol polyphosphate multikinase [Penicillium subrubescens]|uniref:Kinase n=2 Tax=Penicillium subrubescens TaxID=1316194 RepID=A0A1Q5UDF0_9EURO|nr:Inositol polyphosphate multikinase [Penicillium subrubescens]